MVSRVEREMKVDSLTGQVTAAYPWRNCVRRMVENRRQAQRVQENMERHMLDVGTFAGYVAEMNKSIAEGKVRYLTSQEMADWHGPVHYITTFAVVKPESVSTKTRVVSNSAMRNARSKLSLNQCIVARPKCLERPPRLSHILAGSPGSPHDRSPEGLSVHLHGPNGITPASLPVSRAPHRRVEGSGLSPGQPSAMYPRGSS